MAQAETAGKEEPLSDIVLYPFRKWLDFIKIKGLDYYFGLLKISFAAIAVPFLFLLAFLLVFGGAGYLIGPDNIFSMNPWAFLALILVLMAVCFAFFFFLYWIMLALQLTALAYTDSMFYGKRFSIWETFSRIKYDVLKQILTLAGIHILLYLPALLLAVFLFIAVLAMFLLTYAYPGMSAFMVVAGIIIYLLFYLASIAYSLFTYAFYAAFGFVSQFWALEYILGGRPVLEALKQSFRIVKNSLLETFLFNILAGFVACILSIPVFALLLVMYFAPYISPFLLSGFGIAEIAAISFAGFAIWLLLLIVFGSVALTFSLPANYLFWIKARKRVK